MGPLGAGHLGVEVLHVGPKLSARGGPEDAVQRERALEVLVALVAGQQFGAGGGGGVGRGGGEGGDWAGGAGAGRGSEEGGVGRRGTPFFSSDGRRRGCAWNVKLDL